MVLMGGDWKQLLPVVKEAYSVEILDYTLKKSRHWARFKVSRRRDYIRETGNLFRPSL